MTDFWAIGPTAAAVILRARGFLPREAARLVRLKVHYVRGDFRELTPGQRRLAHLLFLRSLAQQGRFDDGEAARTTLNGRSAA